MHMLLILTHRVLPQVSNYSLNFNPAAGRQWQCLVPNGIQTASANNIDIFKVTERATWVIH